MAKIYLLQVVDIGTNNLKMIVGADLLVKIIKCCKSLGVSLTFDQELTSKEKYSLRW